MSGIERAVKSGVSPAAETSVAATTVPDTETESNCLAFVRTR